MEALEKYYSEYLMGYAQDSNFEGYDIDKQITKDRIERILEAGFMTEDDVECVKSILPDIENYKNKSSQYREKYIADREYEYSDEKIVVNIKIQEIEAIKIKNNLDYINAQMNNFPPIL